MTINTIQRAFELRQPKTMKLENANELDVNCKSLFAPTKMVSRAAERTTPPSWVEKIIEFFTSIFNQPSRETRRSTEIRTVLSNIKNNYYSNDPVLYSNEDYQIEKNSLGEIVLYKCEYFELATDKHYWFGPSASDFTYSSVISPLAQYSKVKLIKHEVKVLVKKKHLSIFLQTMKSTDFNI